MRVSVESLSTLERRMTVGLPSADIDAEVNKRLQRAAGEVKMNGFRRGKVPLTVVRQRFGQGIREEVLGDLINRAYFDAIQQEKLQPAGMPSINANPEAAADAGEFEFVALFEVFPDVALQPFSGLSITRWHGEVTDADIDTMLDTLRQQQSNFETVERAAALGDQVTLDYEGFKGGEAFVGGKGENQKLVLGSGQMIPGFEDALVGMSAGEEKTAALAFPDDYHNEELKGQAVEFKLKVHAVAAKSLPELNDDFFRRFGVQEGGLSTFREEVRKNMTREMKGAALNRLKQSVIDALLSTHDVTLPAALVSREINQMRQQMMQQFGDMAKKIDPASIFPDDMFREQANKRVSTGLVFAEIIKQRDVKVDTARVKSKVEEMASVYNNPAEVVKHYLSNRELLAGIENMVLEEQVIDLILSESAVEEKQSNYQEIVRREEQDNG